MRLTPPPSAVLTSLVLSLLAAGAEAAEWEHVATREGVVVHKQAVPGRSLPRFKGEGDIPAGIIEILSVLNDNKRHTEWMHNCIGAERLMKVDDFNYLVYNRTDAPWPVWDRDVVVQSQVMIKKGGDEILIRFRAVKAKIKPPVDEVIRMTRLNGSWHFTKKAEGVTHAEYRIDADPGGDIPKWLAARTAEDIPFNTINNLRKQVAKTRGQYSEFVTKWETRMQAYRKEHLARQPAAGGDEEAAEKGAE